MVGTVLGRYRIENELGRGAMGVVYRARDLLLDRLVAVKVLGQELHSHPNAWGILLREARLASAMSHPNICTIFDAGEEDHMPYIVMEYIEGHTVRELLLPLGLPPVLAATIGGQIARALAYAHAHGVIHRDIKSLNIVITNQGDVKILDFGLAKRIRVDSAQASSSAGSYAQGLDRVKGTLYYVAPEVLRGDRANVPSDIWALGILLYEMVTATFPFVGNNIFDLAMKIMTQIPPPLPKKVPAWLARVILKCLQQDIRSRYACAHDILRDLPAELTPDLSEDLARRFDRLQTRPTRHSTQAVGAA